MNDPDKNKDFSVGNKVTTSRYTWWNFVPLNLFLQFQRPANVFFVYIMILQIIPETSITNGTPTMLLPIAFVLSVTAAKDFMEDWSRKRADKIENNRVVSVVKPSGEEVPTLWRNVVVGDTVKVKNREMVPGDLVLLSSSDANGLAYVMTANLDGETNLKLRKANPDILGDAELKAVRGTVQCEPPNKNIETF